MNKIFILHFQPIELYPPIQNLVRVIEKSALDKKIFIFSTTGLFSELDLFKSDNLNIKIIRLGTSGSKMSKISRGLNYLQFYLGSLLYLLIFWPKKILYYETLSSFTPYLYKRFFNRNSKIYIHYHEYTSKEEYQNGMFLTKLFHRYEKYLYPKVKWLSHTNKNRMQIFKEDIAPIKLFNDKIFANYPPKSWFTLPLKLNNTPLYIVYAGSLSMDTMYTQKFSEWVQSQQGKVIWHIYSYNITLEATEYFKKINSPNIILKAGLNYQELPDVLKIYTVGVILYKGHIPNYVFNAPNKLFEYLNCGLDVWYPEIMEGCYPYDSVSTAPNVVRLNFEALDPNQIDKININEKHYNMHSFNAENESVEIIDSLLK